MVGQVRAVVMPGPHRSLEARSFPRPQPQPGGAVLEMLASEVCGTDVHLHHGRLAGVPCPIIPGHLSCGRLVEVNGAVVVVGQYTDAGEVSLSPHRQLNRKHVPVPGCWGYEYTHLHRSLLMMARHNSRFRWREMITREYDLDEAESALRDMAGFSVVKALIRPHAR